MLIETFRLAVASLARSRRRTLLTAGALANAVVGGLLFFGFIRHSYWGLAESFARGGNGHVQIADADWFDAAAPEEHRVERARLEAARAALLADPAIAERLAASAIRRNVVGMFNAGTRSGVFVGVGTEPGAEPIIAPLLTPDAGRALTADDTTAVVLGDALGARLGVAPGTTVTALVNTDRGLTNAMDLEAVGLAGTGMLELDRTAATLPLDTALALVDGTTADLLVLALGDTDDTDRVVADARRVLAAGGFDELAARPWHDRASYYQAVRALYDRIFGVFQALMALVTVLSLSHAVAAVVAERRHEIAMLRVIGLRRRDVAGLFVMEGALLGALGCVGGVGIAHLVAAVTERLGGIPMPPPPGFSVGYPALFHLDGLAYAVVLPVILVAAVLASALPAWRATRGELSRGLAGLAVLIAVATVSGSGAAAPPAGAPGTAGTRGADATGAAPAAGTAGTGAAGTGAAGTGAAGTGAAPAAASADLSAARAALAKADAASALPAGQRCVVDLAVTDAAGVTRWRVAMAGADTLVVSTSLAEGRRQAVLQRGADTWFQTEAMANPMKVGGAQRLTGQLAVGDLLAPRLAAVWEPTGLVRGALTTVPAAAKAGATVSWPRAELDFDAAGVLRSGRFFAPSGKLARSATWRWEGRALRALDVVDAARGDARTTVALDAPRCAAGALGVTPETLLDAARKLAGE